MKYTIHETIYKPLFATILTKYNIYLTYCFIFKYLFIVFKRIVAI